MLLLLLLQLRQAAGTLQVAEADRGGGNDTHHRVEVRWGHRVLLR
jgi:hypothetical protein